MPRSSLSLPLLGSLAVAFIVVTVSARSQAPAGERTLTVLFDNTLNAASGSGCTAGWGFSALIEGDGRTMLFDAGADESVFRKNLDALHVDLEKADLVFISHDHGDHTGGLPELLRRKRGVPVYAPAAARAEFQADVRTKGGRVVPVKEPQEVAPGVWSTGDLGQAIHEQALLIDTPRGLVVVTGCAHPGIVSIVETAKSVRRKDVRMVLGGFHLNQTPPAAVEAVIARFKSLGVQQVGATHCTGEPAIAMFRKAFGSDFVELGVGRKIQL